MQCFINPLSLQKQTVWVFTSLWWEGLWIFYEILFIYLFILYIFFRMVTCIMWGFRFWTRSQLNNHYKIFKTASIGLQGSFVFIARFKFLLWSGNYLGNFFLIWLSSGLRQTSSVGYSMHVFVESWGHKSACRMLQCCGVADAWSSVYNKFPLYIRVGKHLFHGKPFLRNSSTQNQTLVRWEETLFEQ